MLSIHKNYKEDHPKGEHGHPHPHMPHVGMRKVKSILALLAAFLIWQPFRLLYPDLEVHPIFIYIYALLEIRDNSAKTVSLAITRDNTDYTVDADIQAHTGNVGEIQIYDKQLNGFKVKYDGSAESATLILRIKGGK